MKLSAIVLTKNEEQNIEACLAGLAWADEVLVVDSESTDHTAALAEKCGAKVFTHPFTDFATQRNFGIDQAKGDWILFVDADERVTPELAAEIKNSLNQDPSPYVYAIPRHTYFFGKRLRFGDAREDAPIRLFPRQGVRWTQPVHEKIVTRLPVRWLKGPLLHYSTRDFAHYKQKVQNYVPLELETMNAKDVRPNILKVILMPPVRFFYLFFWRLGILDGIAGLQYAILSAYYTFVKHWHYFKESKKSL